MVELQCKQAKTIEIQCKKRWLCAPNIWNGFARDGKTKSHHTHTHWSIWLRLIHFEFLKCFSSVLLLLHKWIDCIELNTHVKRFDFKTIEKSHFKWWNVEWAHLFECMFGIDSERTFGISFLKSVLIYTNLTLELTQNISVESVLYIIGLCNVQVWIDLHTHGREWRKKTNQPERIRTM